MKVVFMHALQLNLSVSLFLICILIFHRRCKSKDYALKLRCLLWGMVGIRFCFPVLPRNKFSLIPEEQAGKIADTFSKVTFSSGQRNVEQNAGMIPNRMSALDIMAIIWITGIVILVLYNMVQYIRLKMRLRECILLEDNIYQGDIVDTPFVMDIFEPKIYLPSRIEETEIPFIVAHENVHIQRKDMLWKSVAFFILLFSWMNPLMWVAYYVFSEDMELICDENAVSGRSYKYKQQYAKILVKYSLPNLINGTQLLFGAKPIKKRIRVLLEQKNITMKKTISFLIICIVFAFVFLTNPVQAIKQPKIDNIQDRVTEINEEMESKSPDLKVIVKNGVIVFENLDAAYAYLLRNDSAGIALIQKEFGLDAPNPENYVSYKILGGQVKGGTEEEQQQAAFVSVFFDIYEN